MRGIALTLVALVGLGGCTPPLATVPAPVIAALPQCRTTTPSLRTDGDTPARHERIVAEVSKGGHEIAFLGASIIERWATVGKENWNTVWVPKHAVDCGIGGDRTQHVLARLDHGLLDALAAPSNNIKWVVINIGSNNTDVDTGQQIAAGTEAIIARLRARLPRARIALILLFPRGHWPNPLRDTIASANAYLRLFAASDPEHVRLIDVGSKFLKPNGELPVETMPDFLHPAAAGYSIVSESLERVMR